MGEELECPSHPTLTPKKKCRHHQQQIYAKDSLLQHPAEGCGRCWAEKHVEKKVLPCQRAWELPLRLESPEQVSQCFQEEALVIRAQYPPLTPPRYQMWHWKEPERRLKPQPHCQGKRASQVRQRPRQWQTHRNQRKGLTLEAQQQRKAKIR